MAAEYEILFDEHLAHHAIYICGVARKRYSVKKNYDHKVHLAIKPKANATTCYAIETWRVELDNGEVLSIPRLDQLDPATQRLPPAFTTCRTFRWGQSYFREVQP